VNIRVLIFVALLTSAAWPQQAAKESAADLLRAALNAMGGEQKVRDLKTIHFTSIAHRNLLEQSERPEGPYILEYAHSEEWRDLEHGNWKQEAKTQDVLEQNARTVIVSGGVAAQKFGEREMPASGEELQDAEDALTLSPERVLLSGLENAALKRLPDLTLQDVPHHLVEFTQNGTPVRVFLNAETHLPTGVEWVKAYPYGIFWSIWGDVTTRAYYSLWWLQDGFHYPLQMDVFRNGMPDRTATITKIEFNPSVPPDTFSISAASRDAFLARGKVTADERPLGPRPPLEAAPGIVILPGAWNTTIVRQNDGIVILEAPISSGYSVKVIAEAARRYPGVPIKAVITTSDAWPHIGGVREYVARGIPVYAVPRTLPLLQRFLSAPRTRFPDALAKSSRKPVFRFVNEKVTVGSGPNRMEVYPLSGETTERQLMVYFPEHKLLYGSDAFQKTPDGNWFYPQTISEVTGAAEREHLAVENFFMMHMSVTQWQEAVKATQSATRAQP
jgi:glyoxylase-like metal-dependent hydrolase (beta-lactamase superfamily II)